MSEQLLTLVLGYGVIALVPILAGAAVGLPLPASLLLLAAGAFAGGGQLALTPLVIGGLIAVVAGDSAGFWIGKRGGAGALARWGDRLRVDAAMIAHAEGLFARWGGLAVLLTRFLITPLAPAINILAGAGRYPFRSFAFYDVTGEAVWVLGYLGLGYAFSASWDVLADLLGNATSALALLVVIAILVVLLARALKHRHDDARQREATDRQDAPDPETSGAGLP